MRQSILHEEGFDPLGMRKDHAKTNRATVILHVELVARGPPGELRVGSASGGDRQQNCLTAPRVLGDNSGLS